MIDSLSLHPLHITDSMHNYSEHHLQMKSYKYIISFLIILIPKIFFGQLFPSISNFNGEIEKVVEKRFGKEVYLLNRRIGIYLPRCYSGWKYVYYLDTNGKLERRINSFKGKLRADYIYKYDSTKDAIHEREIDNDTVNNHKGNYIEDEYIFDSGGKIEKVNIWSFDSTVGSKKIFIVEKDIQYDSLNNIISYYRHGYDVNGKETIGELYIILYDSLSRVIAVEEKAIDQKTIVVESENLTWTFKNVPITEPELLKKWTYKYNSIGQLVSYSIKHFGEIYKANSDDGKDFQVFFKYDNKNNWIKMYEQMGNSKKRLEAKRRIKYKKRCTINRAMLNLLTQL